jgi:ectoine hydroxylase-related dioxygenase (phytanoyl-CoA dioxygenase family)
MDCGFTQPTWPVFAVKLFAFFGEVGPCGGGTMLLPGSHRLVDRYRKRFDSPPASGRSNWHPFLRRHPPLGDLLHGADLPDHGRSMVGQTVEVDGVDIDVVELCGRPGDVVITHLHVFHTGSPNTSDQPRQMLGKAIHAA